MPTTDKLKQKLIDKLDELFQLDQPDLDFGFYRIMHAKSDQIRTFIHENLIQEIEDTFGAQEESSSADLIAAAKDKLTATLGDAAFDEDGNIAEQFVSSPIAAQYLEEIARINSLKDNLSAEAEIYDHLYRFFERYYDEGDFLSRRYYSSENSQKAAPYAIPYNGEEVKLHWANADQYYIKTTEYFSNYSFDITKSAENRNLKGEERELSGIPNKPLKVHFKIVDASEGEHGNIKAADDKKRFFLLYEENPVEFNEAGELVVNFEYKQTANGKNDVDKETTSLLKERYGKSMNKGDMPNLNIADKIIEAIKVLDNKSNYLGALQLIAPTDKIPKRPLLTKYINQYTARNTCDYFIHKDLGGFLKRELDFYIKNEVMHLDDIENADAPAVESYLAKLKVIRKIATQLIAFLTQLEEFQKKLWLKKKFVTETNYCITLDRVPEGLYSEIVTNDAQREEWIKLFAIDEIIATNGNLLEGGKTAYAEPLTVEFLKENDNLVLDTTFFSYEFKAMLLDSIDNFDDQCDGLLIHSENFQALNLLQERYHEQVKCVYIDPPYNKGNDFAYKDDYQHSSWLSSLKDKTNALSPLLMSNGVQWTSLDENEAENFNRLMKQIGIFRETKLLTAITNLKGLYDADGFVATHEYVICGTVNNLKDIGELPVSEEQLENDWSEDSYGLFKQGDGLRRTGADAPRERRPNGWFPVYVTEDGDIYVTEDDQPNNSKDTPVYPIDSNNNELSWSWSKKKIRGETHNLILKGSKESGYSFYKKQRPGLGGYPTRKSKSFLYKPEYSSTHGGNTAKDLFDLRKSDFTPKSVSLLKDLIFLGKSEGSTVLDYFAGSGTTGQAVINLNREDDGNRKYILVEMGNYFDTVTKPRIQKVIYATDWKNGKPTNRDTGISHCFKYIRLESYEDTLNNLELNNNQTRDKAIEQNDSLKEDYMLNYLLDIETSGSQSLINIDNFTDPTAYKLNIKKAGSDEQVEQNIDLIETFNYLIGLRVNNMAAPQTFTADFVRKPDPELPEDQQTKLTLNGKLKQSTNGKWWFRKIEGWLPADPRNPNNGQVERVLIVWRKLTGNIEEDNLMLDEWFRKFGISTQDFEYDRIYVNGTNNLPNIRKDDEDWKVLLIEEEFYKKMWETE